MLWLGEARKGLSSGPEGLRVAFCFHCACILWKHAGDILCQEARWREAVLIALASLLPFGGGEECVRVFLSHGGAEHGGYGASVPRALNFWA